MDLNVLTVIVVVLILAGPEWAFVALCVALGLDLAGVLAL